MNAFTLNIADQTQLDNFLVDVENHSKMIMGYPTTRDLDCSDLTPFMNYALNKVGDPFIESTSKTNSRQFEQDVLKPMAKWTTTTYTKQLTLTEMHRLLFLPILVQQ